jgi:hypothetical protein
MLKPIGLCLLGLTLAGCAREAPAWLAAPAEAPAPTRATPAPAPVTADARPWATVEPGDWAELNRRVSPKGAAK